MLANISAACVIGACRCIYLISILVCRNPIGRTGMKGRGLLGRWGPNHAVDPIVSRWQRDGKGEKVMMAGKPVMEFVAIKRKDTGDWAIPGVKITLLLM